MRKLFLLLLTLSTFIAQSQLRDSLVIKRDIFTIIYSEKLEQPLNVKYKVLCSSGTDNRTGLDFKTEKGIKTSNALDYLHNDYDKGHLCPSADMDCDFDKMKATFTYLNCSLQNQYLNRGTWKYLEVHERDLASKYKDVSVEVTLHFSDSSKKLITGATVPDAFTKKIFYNGICEEYFFKNETPKFEDFNRYRVLGDEKH